MRLVLILIFILFQMQLSAQEIKFLEGKEPGKAKLKDISWLTGHWTGYISESKIDEIWTNEAAGQMMGMFRLYKDEISIYEFMTIAEEKGSLVLKIKHFDKNLNAWEEKNDYEEFQLVETENNAAYFDAFTFALINDSLNIHLIIDEKNGKKEAALFKYSKVAN